MNSLFTVTRERVLAILVGLVLGFVGIVFVAPSAIAAEATSVSVDCLENGDAVLTVTQDNLVPGSSVVFGGVTDGGTAFNTTALVDENGVAAPTVTFTAATFAPGEYSMNNIDGSVIVSGRFGDSVDCSPPATLTTTLLGGDCPNTNGGVASVAVNVHSDQAGVPLELNVRWNDGTTASATATTVANDVVNLEASAATSLFSGHWSVSTGSTVLTEADFSFNCGAPTLTFGASTPTTITVGQSVTLNWSSVNADSMVADGPSWFGFKPLNGSAVVTPPVGTHTFTLTASNNSGIPTVKTVTVTVNPAAPVGPTLTLTSSATTVATGSCFTLSWNAQNTTRIDASGAWHGNKMVPVGSKQMKESKPGTYTYTLTARNASGQTTVKSVTVTVIKGTKPPVGCR